MKDLRRALRLDRVITRPTVAKMIRRDKRETAGVQPEIKVGRHSQAAVRKSDSRTIHGQRRQRRPAAVIVAGTPSHPRWRPHGVGIPAPAEPGMAEPAAIVKRRAPRIIRIPIPAIIRINPMPAVAIWTPSRVINHRCRTPATAIAIHLHPGTVGRQRVIEISFGHVRWRRDVGGDGSDCGIVNRSRHRGRHSRSGV